jgi:hypothetical protein
MNIPNHQITLQLAPDTAHTHCLAIMQQARNSSHALASLIALLSFITAAAQPADLATPAFGVIKGIINGHITSLRAELQVEQARALATALRATDCAAITKIHLDSSRNAFWQAAQTAMHELDAAEKINISEWALTWHTDAQDSALAASDYPDALNFQKAGISVQEFTAMTDLNNCLLANT